MYSLQVTVMTKESSQVDNTDYICVSFDIIDAAGAVVESKKHSFPLDITDADLQAELKKVLETYNEDKEQAIENAKREQAQVNADQLIQTFTGKKITLQENVAVAAAPEPVQG